MSRTLHRLGVLGAGVVAGLLLVAAAGTARGTDLRGGTRSELDDLVRAAAQRGDRVQADVERVDAEVQALVAARPAIDERVRAAQAAAAEAGATDVTGPGVQVTLDDAPPDVRPEGLGPDDLVVHQQDVEAVINALWAGGAVGIQVMDQRLLTTSAVRCVGSTLILGGRVYSPPFVVTAVGDPGRLSDSLADAPGVRLFRDYVEIAGLRYDERRLAEVSLPGAPIPTLEHARAAA